jgi:hypothetical protein
MSLATSAWAAVISAGVESVTATSAAHSSQDRDRREPASALDA